jgi:peptidoglycan/LPS O-acetylase OafA/YrhL
MTLGYTRGLDGIRGLAIIPVMLAHSGLPYIWYRGGFVGVEIFFVLSGFLITTILIQEHDEKGRIHFQRFYAHRFLRLFPALFLLLSAIVFLSILFLHGDALKNQLKEAFFMFIYAINWVRAFSFSSTDLLEHGWSLAIEGQFYLLWPALLALLFWLVKDKKKIAACIAGLIVLIWMYRITLLAHGASFPRLFNGLDTAGDMLLTGCLLAFVLPAFEKDGTKNRVAGWLRYAAPGALLALLLVYLRVTWDSPSVYEWILPVIALSSSILVLTVFFGNGMVKNFLSHPGLVWNGKISYGLYLYHYPIYKLLMHQDASDASVFVFGTIAVYAVSIASFYLVERPIASLKRYF